MVRGFQGKDPSDPERVAACAKHYLGYGAAEAGKDYNTTYIPEQLLREVYLAPFRACVDAGVMTLMSAFNDLNGIPATGNEFHVCASSSSRNLVLGLRRQRLGLHLGDGRPWILRERRGSGRQAVARGRRHGDGHRDLPARAPPVWSNVGSFRSSWSMKPCGGFSTSSSGWACLRGRMPRHPERACCSRPSTARSRAKP